MNLTINKQIVPSGTSMGASVTSSAQELTRGMTFAIQAVFTGSPNGTFKLQSSCDSSTNNLFLQNPTNWTDIAGSSNAVTTSGDLTWNYEIAGFNWVRLVYTRNSGNGSLVATINVKG